jgi:hypothetical protein
VYQLGSSLSDQKMAAGLKMPFLAVAFPKASPPVPIQRTVNGSLSRWQFCALSAPKLPPVSESDEAFEYPECTVPSLPQAVTGRNRGPADPGPAATPGEAKPKRREG